MRLQCLPYQGLSCSAVSGSSTISSTRRRSPSIVSKSDRSRRAASSGSSTFTWVSSHMADVQPSPTRFTSGWAPVTTWVKLRMRSACQPGSRLRNQSTSVGPLLRSPTAEGVRWNT